MSPGRSKLRASHALAHESNNGEASLLPALFDWLVATGRLGTQTTVAYEVPWMGRRVDLALLTRKGIVLPLQLKVGSLQRAIEQATYNQASFHRSWIVTPNSPQPSGLEWARSMGVGIIVIKDGKVAVAAAAPTQEPDRSVLGRLRRAIRARAQGTD